MAYTTIDDPTSFFNTILHTGNGGTQSITGVGFQTDWSWIKRRDGSAFHVVTDSVRGATKQIYPNDTQAQGTRVQGLQSFDSDGYTLGNEGDTNGSSQTYVGWNWLAGGTAPAITYTVKVVSDSGNKYRFDDFGTSAVTLDLQEGGTYTFDQSDSSNSGHPLRFYTASDKSGGEYTTGVTTTGTAGSSGAKTVITVAASAPTLYYQCSNHAGMGGQANTNSTFGSSNFSGSIQSTASAGSTQGFSIVSYTGTGSTATIGHGLSSTPEVVLIKCISDATNWHMYHSSVTTADNQVMYLDLNYALSTLTTSSFDVSEFSSSVFGLNTNDAVNGSGRTYIAYCFAEKKGYSKFGSYTGNGNADGSFVYTGFKPAWIFIKDSDSTQAWFMYDNIRDTINPNTKIIIANTSGAEEDSASTGNTFDIDFLSNGFKIRTTDGGVNSSGNEYITMAFAENPFVNSNGIPTNAR